MRKETNVDMNDTNIIQKENIKILHTQEEICDQGCKFFIQAESTRFSSAYLRWLSARKDGGNYYSTYQEKADGYIKEKAKDENDPLANLRVLLYTDPTELKDTKSAEYIKYMLKAGADIRYCKTDNPIRLAIQSNQLLLSWSSSDNNKDNPLSKKTVNRGMYYTGVPNNDPLIEYYTNYFDRLFDKAKKLKLNEKKNKIEFEDGWIKRIWRDYKTTILSTLAGGLLPYIIQFIIFLVSLLS